MNINATLVIQTFNFFIVYWLLRSFLFKPVITIIEHEKAQEITLLATIDQQTKSLEIQEKERKRHWYLCQEYFNTHQPHITQKISLLTDTELAIPIVAQLSSDDIAHIIADTHSIIEEKIKHVH